MANDPTWRRGDRLSADDLMALKDSTPRQVTGGTGARLSKFGRRLMVNAQARGGGGGISPIIIAADYATLNGFTPNDGKLGYTLDLDNSYIRSNGAWRVFPWFKGSAAPSSIGEQNGDGWYDTSNGKMMVREGAAWKNWDNYD